MTHRPVSIRSATAQDAPAMASLISASAREFIISDYDDEGKNTMLNSLVPQAFIENMDDGFRYWVAETGGEIAGVIGLKPPSHLFHLFVAKTWQGKGLARLLWQQLLAEVENRYPAYERITVNASRFAIPVYQKLGFDFANGSLQSCTHRGVICYPMVYAADQVAQQARMSASE